MVKGCTLTQSLHLLLSFKSTIMLALKSFFILGAATLAAASLGDTCKTVSVNDQGIMEASCGDGKGGWNDASLDLNKCFKRSQDPALIYMPDQE